MSHRRRKLGLPAGTLVDNQERKHQRVDVTVMDYNEENYAEYSVSDSETLCDCVNNGHVSWINVDGIHDSKLIQEIGDKFNLHPLLLEDVMNPYHRPKIEDYEDYIHFTMKMISFNTRTRKIESEQVSFVLGKQWVISFQETPDDVFENIRDRIRTGKGGVRKRGADYLVYTLADIIVDHYFLTIDELDFEINILEEGIVNDTRENAIEEIQRLKKDLIFLRKSILPVRDAVGSLQKGASPLIEERTTVFLKDVYDHTLFITDSIEVYREMLNSLMEVHLSALSNRLNQVMKVLTVISTIFIPLTFIVGVYGMNFKVFPELDWKLGYLFVWILMIVVTVILIIILKRKKWM